MGWGSGVCVHVCVIVSSPLHLGVHPGQPLLIDKNQSRFLKAPALGVEFPLGIIKYLFIHGLLLGGEALPPQLSRGQLPPHSFPLGQSRAKMPDPGQVTPLLLASVYQL